MPESTAIPDPEQWEETSTSGRAAKDSDDGPMSDEDVRAALRDLVSTSEEYIDTEVSPNRAKATSYYKGDPLGNEEDGRSKIVMTVVRDVVLSIMPSLLRLVYGSDRAVEFVPTRPDLEATCRLISEYITHLYVDQPGGILEIQSCLKDGLVRRLGFLKWWWETEDIHETLQYDSLTREQLVVFEMDATVSYSITKEYQAEDKTPLYACSVTRSLSRGRARWAAVPPEEILYNRTARALNKEGAIAITHRQERTVSDLVKMGFDYDEIVEHATEESKLDLNAEAIARNPTASINQNDSVISDSKASWKVPFYETYAVLDEDGDRRAELRKYYLVGQYELLKPPGMEDDALWGEPIYEIPIAAWCPDPEPHTVEGQSWADLTMDLQRVETALLRGNLDSMGLSLHPRVAYDPTRVNPHDILNTEVGAGLRTVGDPNVALMEFAHNYVGKESFPLIQHMRDVRAERTAQNQASQGLDSDALQSTEKSAVAATLSGAQARTELVARFFLEQVARPLFRGLYRLHKQHQDYDQQVRLNGKFVTVDPRAWDGDLEAKVMLQLGGGSREQRLAVLQGIKAEQATILTTLGPNNPLVSLAQYYNTLAALTEIAGHPQVDKFFTEITAEQAAQFAKRAQQDAQKAPPPDPAMMLAQSQIQVAQGELMLKQAEFQLKQEEFSFDQQFKMEQLRQTTILGVEELKLKYNARIQENQVDAAIRGQGHAMEAISEASRQESDTALRLHEIETKAETDRQGQKVKATADVVKAKITADAKPAPKGPNGK